ncbi:MAG TPA: YbhB/YbcL family Raf kinase inhibitor-like protein, partial [Plesiomonas shigelloides]|nr:YbhB/YbcL family Raf kinase inhibitor-like protein [Plesiomonas shigelloides]
MKAASLLTLMAAVSFGASAMTLNSSDIQEGSRM